MSNHYFVSAAVISRGHLRRALGVCLAAILGATLGQQVQAQTPRRNQGPPKAQPPQPVDADGSVVSVQGSAIQLTTATNQTIMAVITPMTSVRVTGPATAEALQAKGSGSHSKLCVEFVADLAEGGKAKAAISRLAIITAGPGRPQGLLPETAAFQPPPAPVAGHGKVGGAGANAGGDGGGLTGPVGGKTGHGKAHSKDGDGLDLGVGAASGPVKPPCVCTVRGTVKSCHGNSLIVTAGKTTVTAELADNAQIEIDLSDVSIASRGDKIQLKGQTAGRPELVRAESVQITLAQPFSGGRKKSTGKTAKSEKSAPKSGPAKKAAATEPAEKKEEAAEAKTAAGGDEPKSKTKSKPKIGPDDEY
jgi:hypothetical protein